MRAAYRSRGPVLTHFEEFGATIMFAGGIAIRSAAFGSARHGQCLVGTGAVQHMDDGVGPLSYR